MKQSNKQAINLIEMTANQDSVYQIESTDVMTGDTNRSRYLYYQLKMSIANAERIDIVVSFLMESGVRMLLKDLKNALDRGVKIRLLTGNYLGITQPSALYLIKRELGERVDLRFYNDKNRSFHAKAYIFHQQLKSEIYVGSSNISRSALTSGIEWNYKFSSQTDRDSYQSFYDTFVDLLENHSIVINDQVLAEYAKHWKRPAVARDLAKYDLHGQDNEIIEELYQPRGAQIEALYALENSRAEGADRGLVSAATGIGKTYLAAFDSAGYKRVLFVAHREEILNQAAQSFKNVRKSDDYGFFRGGSKDSSPSVIFASVATLGKDEYLQEKYFLADYFDYIIIDEFHHAVTEGYQKIMNYFKPKFLLGLTATPERMDGKNIYQLCDYIVPYQISLQEAINRGLLVSFHYYGIYDETIDYGKIRQIKGQYEEKELVKRLLTKARYDLIYKNYRKYGSKSALGFCRSKKQAQAMAEEFYNRGVKAAAVYSNATDDYTMERNEAVEELRAGRLAVIFCVDMYNEGLDVPNIDMVMFLRPTESPVVFLQQIGRGLRLNKGKEYLNILDFIGNYERAGHAPFLLSGRNYSRKEALHKEQKDYELPEGCQIDFDMRLIDLFKEMAKKQQNRQEIIREEYNRIKDELQKVPTRMEAFTYMEDSVYQLCITQSKSNLFRGYLDYLHDLGELTREEEQFNQGIGRDFIHIIETTAMSKSYKMPILQAFYNNGAIRQAITEDDVYLSMKAFYNRGLNGKDLEQAEGTQDYKNWTKKQYIAKAKNQPIKFLKKSGQGFFVEKKGYALALNDQLEAVIETKVFREQMKDAVEYRTMEYYRKRYQKEK